MLEIFEEDGLFNKSPKDKFKDIVFNANRDLVEAELDEMVKKMAVLEMLLEENTELDFEQVYRQYCYEKVTEVEERSHNLYIELMGNILSQNE